MLSVNSNRAQPYNFPILPPIAFDAVNWISLIQSLGRIFANDAFSERVRHTVCVCECFLHCKCKIHLEHCHPELAATGIERDCVCVRGPVYGNGMGRPGEQIVWFYERAQTIHEPHVKCFIPYVVLVSYCWHRIICVRTSNIGLTQN